MRNPLTRQRAQQRPFRRYQRGAWSVFLAGLVCLVAAQTAAQTLVVVSNPSAPTTPNDPAQGLIFSMPTQLSSSELAFDGAPGPVSLEYVQLDGGTAYITFSDGPLEAAPGGVLVVPGFLRRNAFEATDRLITGAATGLVAPKDLVLVGDNTLVVSDFGGAKLSVFAGDASGDVPPLYELTELGSTSEGEPRRPWGLAFDRGQDRLFVGATDGTILVYDAFSEEGETAPSRTIVPAFKGEQASANTHDLVYIADTDTLIVADVGSATTADQPGFATDGKLFVLTDVGTADGLTEVRLMLTGDSTLLGNPVGLAFDGANLYVTEKAGNAVLRFDNVLELNGELDQFPAGVLTVPAPEGILLVGDD